MNTAIPTRMTDTDKLLEILRSPSVLKTREGWISQREIMHRCQMRHGHSMTVHSRAASLRKKGYNVECKVERKNGRAMSFYRLVTS